VDKLELEKLVEEGLSLKNLAIHFNCSISKIRYWLVQYNLKTKPKFGTPRTAKYEPGDCKYHGRTIFVYETYREGYRCRACRSGVTTIKRRQLKQKLVDEAGGKCIRCGYNKCLWALQFDHRNSEEKLTDVSKLIAQRRLNLALEEIKKCDMLCANCHAEKTAQDMGW
jgi:hypothetical protein